MSEKGITPGIADLYRLSEQIESDRELAVAHLRQRDHAIGQACAATDSAGRLLFWLGRVSAPQAAGSRGWLNEAGAAMLMRAVALLTGFIAMLGFMLASERGLVNVFYFLLLFVLLQLLFSLLSAGVMVRSLRGNPPTVFPLNPARLVASRALPDARYLRESSSVVRLMMLRYGQEFGASFTLGAMAGFFCLLAFTDFSFVWGSTFGLGDDAVQAATELLASPWSGWLPEAGLTPEIVAATRYHPSQLDLATVSDEHRRGWWPFLLMCMAVYALLPRLLLWLASRLAYRREIRRAFTTFPGSEAVLSRMRAPVVRTQALEAEEHTLPRNPVEIDEGVMLLNWAGAVGEAHYGTLNGLGRVPTANRLAAGLGSPASDAASVAAINAYRPESLLVAVKAWEPPMADLADVLAALDGVPRCTLCLVPLPGKGVAEHSLEEWRGFSRQLSFPVVDAEALYWS
jgi:Protein of unknown function (DUF2868)